MAIRAREGMREAHCEPPPAQGTQWVPGKSRQNPVLQPVLRGPPGSFVFQTSDGAAAPGVSREKNLSHRCEPTGLLPIPLRGSPLRGGIGPL